jgi:DNA-binding GntR family transcriptional regulator
LIKLQRPMAINLRLEANLVGPGEGIRRHAALVTALESNDTDVVLAALAEHGGQRYLQYRRDAAAVAG